MYGTWTKGVAEEQKGLVAFMRAATWPDCIKETSCTTGYQNLGGDIPPGNPTDDQNIGYQDKLMHKYGTSLIFRTQLVQMVLRQRRPTL
jgi:hypothetical protein